MRRRSATVDATAQASAEDAGVGSWERLDVVRVQVHRVGNG